ncbi:MAG: biotin--[acetyl-CoA-carboxylase] ligase [Nitrospirae bacterium]|nr:biotin--[acetyl-CoA-carboxylase] ligase [Nitrospirota bacterium]
MFTKEKIQLVYQGEIIGKEVIFLESTTSTNDTAIETGRQRENPEGIVVVADTQTHGKGRMGRTWISPPGVNLYFTVLLKPPFLPQNASILTLVAAVAVASAIRENTKLPAEIKWPNDIMINGKKAGGILLDMKSGKDKINLIAVGVGLNVNMSLNEFPDEIRQSATSIKIETGSPVDRVELLAKILEELERCYKIILQGDKRALINEWIRLNCTIGQKVKVQDQYRIMTGVAENINENGELVLRLSDGGVETLSAGDVTILKE